MKRHPSLHPLSEHHHHALVQTLEIRRAAKAPAKERTAAFQQIAQRFLQFWETAGRAHFLEEEEILLPVLAHHETLESDAEVMKMLADHTAIRAEAGQLADEVAAHKPVEERLATLAKRLQEHVRLEEDHIFPRIEKTLSAEELRMIGQRFTRLHKKG
jgi:hemerythrin-like domain-containing protein